MNISKRLQKIGRDLQEVASRIGHNTYAPEDIYPPKDPLAELPRPRDRKGEYVRFQGAGRSNRFQGRGRDRVELPRKDFYAQLLMNPKLAGDGDFGEEGLGYWYEADFIAKNDSGDFFGFVGVRGYDEEWKMVESDDDVWAIDKEDAPELWKPPRR